MLGRFSRRRSAITFDLGAAGLRAHQFEQRRTGGGQIALCDTLQFERTIDQAPDQTGQPAPEPTVDPARLSRLIGQGRFIGREVALVLSPPEVQFFPLRLPPQALAQPPERVDQALRWEVAQESRDSADNLEVRHWQLPANPRREANVMAVVISTEAALRWVDQFQQHGLILRRIDVSPCALVRIARQAWTPAQDDLWGVLDLGLRHTTLTVVLGTLPIYIRSLSVGAADWTAKLAQAFEVSYPAAEQIKRTYRLQPVERGHQPTTAGRSLLQAGDLEGAFSGVLRESLRTLGLEVGRCFSYVMHGFPDYTVKRLFLAGGGARLGGLPGVLESELGIPVFTLATGNGNLSWEYPLPNVNVDPLTAASLGAALLDLEAA